MDGLGVSMTSYNTQYTLRDFCLSNRYSYQNCQNKKEEFSKAFVFQKFNQFHID